MKLDILNEINLKNEKCVSEKQIAELIKKSPGCLGLGELDLVGVEVPQVGGGFLDLLLQDGEPTRYCVEVQLGKTDPSHIIRAIEYWDLQRSRYKGIDHVCVLIAEEITGRFFNVITLLGNSVPIVAIKLSAAKNDLGLSIMFSKILDTRQEYYGGDKELDEYVEVDRSYWVERASSASIGVVERIFTLMKDQISNSELNFAKHYIGPKIEGRSRNFCVFHPRKSTMVLEVKLPLEAEILASIEESKCDYLGYNQRYGTYKFSLKSDDEGLNDQFLVGLICKAHDQMMN
ncbi:hypothetical protein I5192_01465 [Ruegeria sp. SCSIO 43209]|uniref:hypothetical protein n=1 Tax=Ruegeria sp. SCSIO 43209 TaxID=2793010 RepID=UPI001CA9269C|nr:hypothetical protein [Ruegeria sp. SCSIO 43209]UAB89381.1 hypothetical protein I5192_01465 [Ruegeria sp. SCSIO 43209]